MSAQEALFNYKGELYPTYLREGNATSFIAATALHFCKGNGLDIGASRWPLAGAIPWELKDGCDGMDLPDYRYDFIYSSHCLEHTVNPVAALEHWKSRIKPGGVLFLYLPSPEQKYWKPQNCRKHLHMFYPSDMAEMLKDLGFVDVIYSERDLAWSFAVVGFAP